MEETHIRPLETETKSEVSVSVSAHSKKEVAHGLLSFSATMITRAMRRHLWWM